MPFFLTTRKNILKNAKKLKGKNIFVNEDFSHETMELRKELWEKVKKHREECNIAYLHYRTIVVKRRNNQGLSYLCLSAQWLFLYIEHM